MGLAYDRRMSQRGQMVTPERAHAVPRRGSTEAARAERADVTDRSSGESALLHLLAHGADHSTIAATDTDPELKELALQIWAAADVRRRREQELEALVDTATDLAAMTDPSFVLDAIVRRTRMLLGADVSYLTLADPERGDTYMRATAGSISADFQNLRLDPGDGLGGLAASTLKPYWTPDYRADDRFQHTGAIDSAVGDEGLLAICGTPLVVKDEFVGVLFAAHRTARAFSPDEVALLGSLATLAAVAIVQVGALDRAERALAELHVAHEDARRHADGVERAAAAHDRFAQLVLGGGGVGDITAALPGLLGGWAALLDPEGRRRSASPNAPETTAVESSHVSARELATSARLTRVGEEWIVPVAAVDDVLGHLVVGGVEALDEADARTIERAAVVTALVLLGERARIDTVLRRRSDLMANLLSGRGDTDALGGSLRALGIDPSAPTCVLVARAEQPVDLRSLALSVGAQLPPEALVGERGRDIVVVMAGSDSSALARDLAGRLARHHSVTVGGAGPSVGVEALPATHVQARRTLDALLALGRAGEGAATEDLGFAGLIVGDSPDVDSWIRSVLGPLMDYDERRGTELVKTLDGYFASGASPRHAATSLHVHVNTVTQRLDRIARILGSSWTDPSRALELQLALHLRRLTG